MPIWKAVLDKFSLKIKKFVDNLPGNRSLRLSRFKFLSVLTPRGWILLGFAAFLIIGPYFKHNDMIAGTLGLTLFGLICLLALFVPILGLFTARKLTVDLTVPSESSLSNQDIPVVLNTSAISIAPLCSVKLKVNYNHGGISTPEIRLSGLKDTTRSCVSFVVTKHRGEWSVTKINASFEDLFGIFRIRWQIKNSSSVRVSVANANAEGLALRSSAEKSGDALDSNQNRQGEPFDLKRYHPSDGMAKIAWKLFARSGELMSRFPEPSVSPDGKAVVYVLAKTEDDQLAATAVNYCQKLESEGIEIFGSCLGAGKAEPRQSSHELLELLIDCAWSSQTDSLVTQASSELFTLLESYNQKHQPSAARSVTIIVGKYALSEESFSSKVLAICQKLSELGIKPVLALVNAEDSSQYQNQTKQISIRGLLLEDVRKTAVRPTFEISQFLKSCMDRSWEVISQ